MKSRFLALLLTACAVALPASATYSTDASACGGGGQVSDEMAARRKVEDYLASFGVLDRVSSINVNVNSKRGVASVQFRKNPVPLLLALRKADSGWVVNG